MTDPLILDRALPDRCVTEAMGYPCRYLRTVPRRDAYRIIKQCCRCVAVKRDLLFDNGQRPVRDSHCPILGRGFVVAEIVDGERGE